MSPALVREVNMCLALLTGGHLPALTSGASTIANEMRAITVSEALKGTETKPALRGAALRGRKNRT